MPKKQEINLASYYSLNHFSPGIRCMLKKVLS